MGESRETEERNREGELFAEALAASEPRASVPPGFAERVLAQLEAPARRAPTASRARRLAAAGAVVTAAAAAGVLAWGARGVEGAVDLSASASDAAPTTVALGRRAQAVIEPGTRLRYRVGGLLPGAVDTVEITRGAAFFRVDRGGGFEVRTPHGTVQVTGTCFRVAVDDAGRARGHDDDSQGGGSGMNTAGGQRGDNTGLGMLRARWFGAGALVAAATMAVTVYEGGVNVASARGRARVHLAPGEAATIGPDGALARTRSSDATSATAAAASSAADALGPPRSEPGVTAPVGASGPIGAADAAREVERLRGLLARNGISPETGTRAPDAGAPRGVDDSGDTDLTQDEWRLLAQRGELRFKVPGMGRTGDVVTDEHARRVGIPEQDRAELNDVIRRSHTRLVSDLRALYREAAGTEPGSMSDQALLNEIRDKTPEEVVANTNWQLAQERAGLAPAQPVRPDMPPYERMMRQLIGYEGQLERELAAIVGERTAHALLFGERAISAHAFGLGARRRAP